MAEVPLRDQILQVEKMIRDDARRFQAQVDKGRWHQDTADRKLAALRAVQSTLTWLEANHEWIKAEARRRWEAERCKAEFERERDLLAGDPTVAAAQEAFPGAEIEDIRPIALEHTEAPEEELEPL